MAGVWKKSSLDVTTIMLPLPVTLPTPIFSGGWTSDSDQLLPARSLDTLVQAGILSKHDPKFWRDTNDLRSFR